MADAPGTHRGSHFSDEERALMMRAIIANLCKGVNQFGALDLLPQGTDDEDGAILPLPTIHYTTYHRWKGRYPEFAAAVLAAMAVGSRRRMQIVHNAFIRNMQRAKPNATMAIFAAVNWSRMGKKHGISDDDAYENLGRGVSVNIGGDGSALLPPKEIRIVTYDHDPAEDEPGGNATPSGEEAAE